MVRLAFSVIINTDPDVLIVDEALAVGDDAFQRKCYARLKQLQAQGVTILLVSHAAGSVVELCDRALLLDRGEVLLEGEPKSVIHNYHKLLHMEGDERERFRQHLHETGLGNSLRQSCSGYRITRRYGFIITSGKSSISSQAEALSRYCNPVYVSLLSCTCGTNVLASDNSDIR